MYLPSITRSIYYESILYLRRHYICNCIALQNLYIPKMIYIIFKRVKILQLLNLQLFFNIRYLSSITRSIYSESNLYLHSIRKFACSKKKNRIWFPLWYLLILRTIVIFWLIFWNRSSSQNSYTLYLWWLQDESIGGFEPLNYLIFHQI